MDEQVRSCTSRAELEQVLEALHTRRAQLRGSLDDLTGKTQPELAMGGIREAREQLASTLNAAYSLGTEVESAAYVSHTVAERINSALKLFKRAQGARVMVDQTMSLKASIDTVHAAMELRDWDKAAHAAHLARSIPSEVRLGSFAARMVPTSELPGLPSETLTAACDDMGALFVREFEKAAAERKMDQVTRYFKLFPMVGHEVTGIQKYGRFISEIIAGQSRSLLLSNGNSQDSSPETNTKFYGLATSRLFENVASILNDHASLVERHYGKAAMIRVVGAIQNELDTQSGLIIDSWWDERRLDRELDEARGYSYPVLVAILTQTRDSEANYQLAHLSTASALLSELVMMLNRWALYQDFIEQRWPDAMPSLAESRLLSKVSELLHPAFETLSLFVFRRSVEKAVDQDDLPAAGSEHQPDSPLVTSMVDDTMYVFKTLLDQLADTKDGAIAAKILPSFRRVLEADFLGVVQRKLQMSSPTRLNAETQSAFLLYLNDMIVTGEYATRLIEAIELFAGLPQASSFVNGLKEKVNSYVDNGCRTYFNAQISPQLKSVHSSFSRASYMMSPNDSDTGAASAFEYNWRKTFTPLKKQLHPAVYNKIAALTATSTAASLEKSIWQLDKKVNELGAIALDRDIGRILSVVSESDYKLRDKFVRVCQLVMIISGEDLETVLHPDEEAQARAIRV